MSRDDQCFQAQELKEFAKKVFLAIGVDAYGSEIMADTMIQADLRGINSHGLLRLSGYVKAIDAGIINIKTTPETVIDLPTVTLMDARHGLGQIAGVKAMETTIRKAKENHISLCLVRNSNHFGMTAYYSTMAAKAGLIGISSTNTRPVMPATGGSAPMIGNNPVAIAAPINNDEMFMLDMAFSVAALGKIRLALSNDESIPLGWAADKDGNPTDNPAKALESMLLLPIGGPKGYGMAMAFDLLSGVLSGSCFGPNVGGIFADLTRFENSGHFFLAINIEAFLPLETFQERITEYVQAVKDSPKASGIDTIYIPGEIEDSKAKENTKKGVFLPGEVIKSLQSLGNRFGIKF